MKAIPSHVAIRPSSAGRSAARLAVGVGSLSVGGASVAGTRGLLVATGGTGVSIPPGVANGVGGGLLVGEGIGAATLQLVPTRTTMIER